MSYAPALTHHLMHEIMRFDERQEPGKTVETILGAILTVATEFINACPDEGRRVELVFDACSFMLRQVNADQKKMVAKAIEIALADVQGNA